MVVQKLKHNPSSTAVSKRAARMALSKFRYRGLSRYNNRYVPKTKQTHYHVRRISALREGDFSVDTLSGLGAYYRALSFHLDDLEGYNELKNLYDQYTITKVVLDFNWTLTATSGSGPNASYAPQINVIRDYDDANTPVASNFRESGRVIRKRLTANNNFRIALRPAVASAMYKIGGVTFGYGPKWNQRIDMANTAVPHFGVKLQVLCPATNVGFVQVTAKYYVSCYQTR